MNSPNEKPKDIYEVWSQSAAKFFDAAEQSASQYRQTAETLRQQYFDAWKSVINSAIALEKQYAQKTGLIAEVPEDTLENARQITEKAIQAYQTQNKIAATNTDMAKKTFEAFNQNAKSFATLNQEIMDSMISVLQQKKS